MVDAAPLAMLPLVAVSRPDARRSRVDLPQPDGPTTDTKSPGPKRRLTSVKATVPVANCMPTPSRTRGDSVVGAAVIAGSHFHAARDAGVGHHATCGEDDAGVCGARQHVAEVGVGHQQE